MQKFLRNVLLVCAMLAPWAAAAQNARVSEYDNVVQTATYTSISSTGTVWSAADRTAGYVDITVPFEFQFGENKLQSNSTLRVYRDGYASFVALPSSKIAPLSSTNGFTAGANSVWYKATSTDLTVEWRKVTSQRTHDGETYNNSYSFQLKLYKNGDVEFCYGPMTLNGNDAVRVGLASNTASDFYRVGADATDGWNAIERYTTSWSTSREIGPSNRPAFDAATNTGLVYTFTKPSCVKAIELAGVGINGGANLSWTSRATNFQIRYSTDANFDPAAGQGTLVTSSTNSKTLTGLTNYTKYYFAVRTICGSTPAAWSDKASFEAGLHINMDSAALKTVTLCDAMVYDNGGPDSARRAKNDTLVIRPGTDGKRIHLVGTQSLGSSILYIYDGDSLNKGYKLHQKSGTDNAIDVYAELGPVTIIVTGTNSGADGFDLHAECVDVIACPSPTNFEVAVVDGVQSLKWKAPRRNNASSYELSFVLPDGDPDNSPWNYVNVNKGTSTDYSYLVSNVSFLTPRTEYEVYIHANCGTDGYSEWIGPIAFRTPCANACYDQIIAEQTYYPASYFGTVNVYTKEVGGEWVFDKAYPYSADPQDVELCPGDSVHFIWSRKSSSSQSSQTLVIRNHYGEVVYRNTCDNLYTGDTIATVVACETPACPRPVLLTSTNNGLLSWKMAGGPATQYDIFIPATSTSVPTADSVTYTNVSATCSDDAIAACSYQLTGLEEMTSYSVYVRAHCGTTVTDWSDKVTFTTPCDAKNIPFEENFSENLSSNQCWRGATGTTAQEVWDGATLNLTSQNWTYASSANSGIEAGHYYKNIYGTSCKSWIVTPEIDLTTATSAQLTFDAVFTGYNSATAASGFESNSTQAFMVLISTDGGQTWPEANAVKWQNEGGEHTLASLAGTSYIPQEVNLNDYLGGTVRIAFYAQSTTSGGDNNLHIDNIYVDVIPTCFAPTAVSAELNDGGNMQVTWTADSRTANPTKWQIGYRVAGTTDDLTVVDAGTTSPYVFTSGLASATTYDFYVRAYCNDADQSKWSSAKGTATTECVAITVTAAQPFTENFESYNAGNFSVACWENVHVSGDGSNIFKVYTSGIGGNSTKKLQLPDQSSGTVTKLRLPQLNLPNDNFQFSIDVYRNTSYSSYTDEGVSVLVSTDGEIEGATELAFIPRVSSASNGVIPAEDYAGWYTYDLPIGVSGNVYIILRGYNMYGAATYMDNIKVSAIPTCFKPSDVTASAITSSGATIGWTPDSRTDEPTGGWEVRYREVGTETYTTVNAAGSASSKELTGLTSNTNYEVSVRAICGGGDNSEWTADITFKTLCGAMTITPNEPYMMEFENTECWTLVSNNTVNASTTTTSSNYFGITTYDNKTVLVFNSWSNASDYYQYAYSPAWQANGAMTVRVRYSTKANTDPVRFGYSTTASVNPSDYTWSDNYLTTGYNDWQTYEVTLPNNAVQFAINYASEGCNYKAYIDYVEIFKAPTCRAPQAVTVEATTTTADIDWTNNSETLPTQWQLRLTEGNGEPVESIITSKPYSLTGLTANTAYTVQVRDICGDGDTSDWSAEYSFRTACEAITVTVAEPYFEGFESTTFPPECWSMTDVDLTVDDYDGAGIQWFLSNYKHDGNYGAAFPYTVDATARLVTPVFNLLANTEYLLNFWYYIPEYQGVADEFYVYYRTAPTAEWTLLQDYTAITNEWTEATLLLPNTSSTYQISFVAVGNDGNYLAIDDIEVSKAPTCLKPQNLAARVALGNESASATLSWNEPKAATTWRVMYSADGSADTTTVTVTGQPTQNLTGLDYNTTYYAKVRSICQVGVDSSDWCGDITFTTPCEPISITARTPYEVGFESPSEFECTYYYGSIDYTDDPVHGGESAYILPYPISKAGDSAAIISRPIHTDLANGYQVGFWMYRDSVSANANKKDLVNVWINTSPDTIGATKLTTVHRSTTQSPVETEGGWYKYTATIPTVGDWFVILEGVTQMGGRNIVDDFEVTRLMTCNVPTDLAASNVTNIGATLTWTEPNTGAEHWVLHYADSATFDPYTEGTAVELDADDVTVENGVASYRWTVEPATTYVVYVQTVCEPGVDSSIISLAPATFTTVCPQDQSVTVGNGGETNGNLPTTTMYNYSLTEQIYTSGEMGGAKDITSVSFYLSSTGATTRTLDIYFAETEKDEFTSSTDWVSVTGMTKVVNAGSMDCNTPGWKTFEFATPYNYTGAQNLIVVVDDNTGSWKSTNFWADATDKNRAIYVRSDGTNYDPVDPTSYTGTLLAKRSTIIFGGPCLTNVTCFAPVDLTMSIDANRTNLDTLRWSVRKDLEPVVDDNFEVKYGLVGFNPNTEGTSQLAQDTFLVLNNLPYESTLEFYVRTVCSDENQSAWAKWNGTVTTYPRCFVPDNISTSGAATQTSISLKWRDNNPTPASKWQVVYGEPGFDTNSARAVTTINNTNFRVDTLTSGDPLHHSTRYEFRVRAACDLEGGNFSYWSAPVYFRTACGVYGYEDMPIEESFDFAKVADTVPACWKQIDTATSLSNKYPRINTTYYNSKSNALLFKDANNNYYKDAYALLPQINFPADTLELDMQVRFNNANSYLVVGLTNDPEAVSDFVSVDTLKAPASGYNSFKPYTVSFRNADNSQVYSHVVLKQPHDKKAYEVYVDDVVLKLREAIYPMSDNGQTIAVCDGYIMPDTTAGNDYHGDVDATYVVSAGKDGFLPKVSGSYDLEDGYDWMEIYLGDSLMGRYTGKGTIKPFMATTNNWDGNPANPQPSGLVTVHFTTDEDNALPHYGFKLLVQCEKTNLCDTLDYTIDTFGVYTWPVNGERYANVVNENRGVYTEQTVTATAADLTRTYASAQLNVGKNDSVYHRLDLTVHPAYNFSFTANLCEGDSLNFYDTVVRTTGNYTVKKSSIYGADSIATLALTVNSLPTVAIYYEGRDTNRLENFCQGADLNLLARSNRANATFLWDDNVTTAARLLNPMEASDTLTVVATDPSTGCASKPATLTLTTTPVPTVTITGTDSVICVGESVTLTFATDDAAPATYAWSTGDTTASITVTPTRTTTYKVNAATTAGNCASEASFTVTVNALPEVTVATSASELCLKDTLTLSATVLDGATYAWENGLSGATVRFVPTTTADYDLTVTDANGCVNTFTTNSVVVRPSYELNDTLKVCEGQLPYAWGTQSLSAAGNYDQTWSVAYGCDSTVHLNFRVEEFAVINSYATRCAGDSLTFGEGIYQRSYVATESTTLTYTDTTSSDCPTQYNLFLTVNPTAASSFERTVCDSAVWNNVVYKESGAQVQHLLTSLNCDSTVTMNLTVNHSNTGIDEQTACGSFTWDDSVYTESTDTPTKVVTNLAGCDSIVTLHLTVNSASRGYYSETWCDSKSFVWTAEKGGNGQTYQLSELDSTVTNVLAGANQYGCDSTVVLLLTMNYVSDTLPWKDTSVYDSWYTQFVDCYGNLQDTNIDYSGEYMFREVRNGHDYIARYRLTVEGTQTRTVRDSWCFDRPYEWRLDSSDPLPVVVINPEEITDSVQDITRNYLDGGIMYVLRLHAIRPEIEDTLVTLCYGEKFKAIDHNLLPVEHTPTTSEKWQWDEIDLPNQCKKLFIADITVNPVYEDTTVLVIRDNQFVFDTIATSPYKGQYIYVVKNPNIDSQLVVLPMTTNEDLTDTVDAYWTTAAGCDSTVTFIYTMVKPTEDTLVVAEACYTYNWERFDRDYAYVDSLNGHILDSVLVDNDSVYTLYRLDLTIKDTHFVDFNRCTEYVGPDGKTYREDMTFVVIDTTFKGCDSVVYQRYHIGQRALNQQYVLSNRPYKWANGEVYDSTVTEVYYATPKVDSAECDSVLMLNFTYLKDYKIELCEGQLPYEDKATGIVFDSTFIGDSVYMNNDAQGNDTIIYYVIHLNDSTSFKENVCDLYKWEDGVYDSTGLYTNKYRNVFGCDSIVTLDLTVRHSSPVTQLKDTACESFVWIVNGTTVDTFTVSGVYNDTVKNAEQCDSILTLTLTINNGVVNRFVESACDSFFWAKDSNVYYTSGEYGYTYTDSNRCESVDSLILTINQSRNRDSLYVNNEGGFRYQSNTGSYYYCQAPFDSTFVEYRTTAEGCPDTLNLHIIVPELKAMINDTVEACGIYTWRNNHTYQWMSSADRQAHGNARYYDVTANKYVYDYPEDTVFKADHQMDSVFVLILRLRQDTSSYDTVNLPMSQDSVVIAGIDAAHSYTLHFTDSTKAFTFDTVLSLGSTYYCDNHLYLHVNGIYDTTLVYDTVCAEATTYAWGTHTITPAAPNNTKVYKDSVANLGDTNEWVYVMNLYTRPATNAIITTKEACDSFTWVATNGDTVATYTVSGKYVHTYENAYGCQQTDSLYLTVSPSYEKTLAAVTACDSYTWYDVDSTVIGTYTQGGPKTHTFKALNGCDSTVTLPLTINVKTDSTLTETVCDTFYWAAKNKGYNRSNFTDTVMLTNVAGCDSIVTLNLTVKYRTDSVFTDTVCDSMMWNNTWYYASINDTIDTDTLGNPLVNAIGCDSIAVLHLTVYKSSPVVLEDTSACDSYAWNGMELTESCDTTFTGKNSYGCDSIATLHLTINKYVVTPDTVSSCGAYYWAVDERTHDASGLYTKRVMDTVATSPSYGCYDTAKLVLTVNPIYQKDSVFYTTDENFRYNGQLLGLGVHNFTINETTVYGCDSVTYLVINVGEVNLVNFDTVVCSQYTWNGKTYTYLTNAERQEHRNGNGDPALYYNATDSAYVYYAPLDTLETDTFDVVYRLRLVLTPSIATTDEVTFPISHRVLKYGVEGDTVYTFDFSAKDAWDFVDMDTTVETRFFSAYYCDSIVDLTIHLVNNYVEDSVAHICADVDSYTWHGVTENTHTDNYDKTNTYYLYDTANLTADQAKYLRLVQHSVTYKTIRRTACDSYTWNGMTLTDTTSANPATLYVTLDDTTMYGCDSTVSLILTLNKNTSRRFDSVVACDSYKWVPTTVADSMIITASGEYFSKKYYTEKGCESVDTIHVTINHPNHYVTVVNTCDSYTHIWGDSTTSITYNTARVNDTITHLYNLPAACKSIDTLVLTIRTATAGTKNITACDSLVWKQDGVDTVFYTTGSYKYTIENVAGCDSVVTLNYTIHNNTSTVTRDVVVCDSYTWKATNDSVVGKYGPGVYALAYNYVTDTAHGNCPSTDSLYLEVRASQHNVYEAVACQSYDWYIDTNFIGTYTASGDDYTYSYPTDSVCTSVDTLKLTIGNGQTTYSTQEVVNCGPYTWTINVGGVDTTIATFNESIETSALVKNPATGCDSIIFLKLTVNTQPEVFESDTICDDMLPYVWRGKTYTASAEDTVHSHYSALCDSVFHLSLTVNETKVTNLDTVQVCLGNGYKGYNFDIPADSLAVSGDYTFTQYEKTVNGCDSTVVLTITVNSILTGTDVVEACDSAEWHGTVYYASNNTATYKTSSLAGCDSIVTLNLTIHRNAGHSVTAMACDEYMWNDNVYDSTGTYYYSYTDGNSCPSVDTLLLTISNSIHSTVAVTACDSYTWNDSTYTATGIYVYNHTTADQCSASDTLWLTLNKSTRSNTTVTACDSYTWNDSTYTASGSYTYKTVNADECDSIATLTLTVNHSTTGVDTQVACDSMEWIDGNVYTASNNTATFTLVNGAGCDSVVTLNLTIKASVKSSFADTACSYYNWNNMAYSQSGVYTQTFEAANGCDSVVTLDLTINTPVSNTFDVTNCGPYTWNGISYATTGNYTQMFTAENGCDSTVTINLTVNMPTTGDTAAFACDEFTWYDSTYTESTIATRVFTGINGCDSTVTLTLTIGHSNAIEVYESACNFYEWDVDHNFYINDTVVSGTLTNVEGCDSVVTLHLTINSPVTVTRGITACDSYTMGEVTYTESGSYSQTYEAANGCDSTVNLNLTINYATTETVIDSACGLYSWNGEILEESGVYTYSTVNAKGCDSTVTLILTINQPVTTSEVVSNCGPYTWNGQTYSTSGVYTFDTIAANGCDSIVTLNLTVINAQNTTDNVVNCGSYSWYGQTYEVSGTYTHDFVDNNGCDAVATLNLTVSDASNTYINVSSCGSYSWHGETYTQSGAYSFDTINSVGCDSTVTLILNISQAAITTINQTACDSYTWHGQTYTTSGEYNYTTSTTDNCDSIVTLILTINESQSTTVNEVACESYNWNGETYTTSGSYQMTFTGRNGCDSTVTLNLTVNQPVAVTLTESACSSYEWNGETYTTSGTYTYTTTSAATGCDSVTTLVLTINQPVYTNLTVTADGGYNWNGETLTESGVYTYTTTAANGCDSVVTLTLTVNPLYTVTLVSDNTTMGTVSESGVIVENGYFTAVATPNDGYRFVAWKNGSEIVSTTATYVFQVTEDITLTAVFEENVGIDDVDMDNVTIYSANSTIFVKGVEGQDVHVYDVNGRMMYRELNATENLEFRMTATGVYLVKVGNAPAKRVVVVR